MQSEKHVLSKGKNNNNNTTNYKCCTCPGPVPSRSSSVARYSCMIHGVRSPFGALPRWKTSVFFIPIPFILTLIHLSFPVAFQYPFSVALFDRWPLGYFFSHGEKKNHSGSPFLITDLPSPNKDQKSTQTPLNPIQNIKKHRLSSTKTPKTHCRFNDKSLNTNEEVSNFFKSQLNSNRSKHHFFFLHINFNSHNTRRHRNKRSKKGQVSPRTKNNKETYWASPRARSGRHPPPESPRHRPFRH